LAAEFGEPRLWLVVCSNLAFDAAERDDNF
jgi:hypothetical protein